MATYSSDSETKLYIFAFFRYVLPHASFIFHPAMCFFPTVTNLNMMTGPTAWNYQSFLSNILLNPPIESGRPYMLDEDCVLVLITYYFLHILCVCKYEINSMSSHTSEILFVLLTVGSIKLFKTRKSFNIRLQS